jgi:Tfp pilus assembly protein PilN
MRRIPVNLATNPIEQRQWLRRVRLVSVAVAAGITVLHLLLAGTLPDEPGSAVTDREAVQPLRAWSAEVAETLTTADPGEARRVAVAAGLANALIDQRVFPWGRLFSALEEIIPDDVRLEIIQPITSVDGVRVTLTAASASGESLREFLAALEERPEFHAVYPGRQLLGPDGELRLSVEALASAGRRSMPGDEERRP